MANAQVVQLRRFTDEQALAWLAPRSPLTTTCTDLAKQFGWHRNTVGTKLRTWAAQGKIARQGKAIIVQKQRAQEAAQGIVHFSNLLSGIMFLAALCMACALLYINATSWSAFAKSTESAWALRVLAVVIDVLAVILPGAAKVAPGRSAITLWAMWALCFLVILWTSIGFAFGNFGDATGNREATIDRRAIVLQDISKKRERLLAQPPYAVTTQQQADAAVEERKRECERGQYCTKARREEARILSARALTAEAKELSDDLDRLEKELKGLPVLAAADPQISGPISAIEQIAGLKIDRHNASAWRDVIFAVMLVLFPGALIRGGISLWRRS